MPDGRSRLFRCLECDLHYFWPARNPGADWYEASDIYLARDADIVDWLAWYHQEALRRMPVRSGRLIDIGCGQGQFVAIARSRGFDAMGIDFAPAAIDAGRRMFGIEQLHVMSIEEALAKFPEPFDLVTAFEVVEHVEDVGEFLGQMVALLAPGGHLIVSMPNRERRPFTSAHGDAPPHHLTRWSRATLRGAFERVGLEPLGTTLSPTSQTLKVALLELMSSGLASRTLREAASASCMDERRAARARVRRLILLKDRLADIGAHVLAPFAAPFVRGSMMIGVARRPAGETA